MENKINNKEISLIFWGGVKEVTGANFLIEAEGKKILIDCGLFQGISDLQHDTDANFKEFPYKPEEIDLLFVTHAHLDHIGRIPRLVKMGFKGRIFSTQETKELSSLMFEDALKIMSYSKKDGKNILYEDSDVRETLNLWTTLSYHAPHIFFEKIKVKAINSGHILGSAAYQFDINGKKILMTGDIGGDDNPLLNNPESLEDNDYMVIESVYGDRDHESLENRRENLLLAIKYIEKTKGVLMIPAFSIEKTQVILYEINELVEEGRMSKIPVFLDSPLAQRVTKIYKRNFDHFKKIVRKDISQGDDIFNFPKLTLTYTRSESQNIDKVSGPKIIIAGSGMSEGGRIINHEKLYLSNPNNAIVFVGFQSAGSLGREIAEGAKSVLIDGQVIEIRAKNISISGYSSHADSKSLLNYIEKNSRKLKKVFVVMGEPKSSIFLAQRVRDYLEIEAEVPQRGKVYKL